MQIISQDSPINFVDNAMETFNPVKTNRQKIPYANLTRISCTKPATLGLGKGVFPPENVSVLILAYLTTVRKSVDLASLWNVMITLVAGRSPA